MKLDGISDELKQELIETEQQVQDDLDKTDFRGSKRNKIYDAIMKYEVERARHSTLARKYNAMVDEKNDLLDKVTKLDQKAAKPVNNRIKALNKKMGVLRKEIDKQEEKALALQPDWEKAGEILDKRLEEVERKEQRKNKR